MGAVLTSFSASSSTALASSRFARFAVMQAVQAVEAAGPLDDATALTQAFAASPERQERVLARAWLLGERLGLPAEWLRWRHLGKLVALALALLMAFSAWAVAQTVLDEGRRINAMAAFVSVLGLHAVTLLGWLLSLVWRGAHRGDWSLGALAMRLTAWLPLDRGPHAAALWQGVRTLMARHRLTPWAFGVISHSVWALAFVLILAALWFGFSFQAYTLSWETTILSEAFFERFVALTGWLPALLGFPVPDGAAVQAAGQHGQGDQRAWAWWLMACTLLYGLVPRVALAAWSAARWRRGTARLALDETDPYLRRLFARFDALEAVQVIDADASLPAEPVRRHAVPAGGGVALLGFELPPELALPASGGAGDWVWQQRIAGSSAERHAVLARLASAGPVAVVLACRAAASPDRGTSRFVRDLQRAGPQVAILLLPDHEASPAACARWQAWVQAEALGEVPVLAGGAALTAWCPTAGRAGSEFKP